MNIGISRIVKRCCAFVLALAWAFAAQAASLDINVGVKSAIVEASYETVGMGSNISGTKTTYMADYGRRQAIRKKEKSTTKVFGFGKTEEKETLTIIDTEWLYEIDLKAKTGTRMSAKILKDFTNGFLRESEKQGKSMQDLQDEWLKKVNGKWIESQVILGKTCKGVEAMGVRSWMYEQVVLKTEGTVMGITTKEYATKFQENASIDESIFKVPAGIKIEDAPDMSGMMDGEALGRAMAGGNQNKAAAQDGEEPKNMGELLGMLGGGVPQEGAEKTPAEGSQSGEGVCGISFSDFKTMAAKVTIKDLRAPKLESEEGSHTATYMKSLFNHVLVSASALTDREEFKAQAAGEKEGEVASGNFKDLKIGGHPAVYFELLAGGQAKGSGLVIFDTNAKATIMINSTPLRSLDELKAIATQLGY